MNPNPWVRNFANHLQLANLPVVRHQPVYFIFDVGELRIYCSAQALFFEWLDFFSHKFMIGCLEFFL